MWWWVLIWFLLVVIAVAYLATRAWRVWGQAKELGAELRHASETVAALQSELDRIGDAPKDPPRIAVFDDPAAARRHRTTTRAALREERRTRRAARLPSWARDVH